MACLQCVKAKVSAAYVKRTAICRTAMVDRCLNGASVVPNATAHARNLAKIALARTDEETMRYELILPLL